MLALRVISLSITPPMVSIPRLRGVTSSNNMSVSLVPASKAAWRAAPTATTSSGFTSIKGSRPKNSRTNLRTSGIRVEPPTRITPSSWSGVIPASSNARSHGPAQRFTTGNAIFSKSCFVSENDNGRTRPLSSTTPSMTPSTSTTSLSVSASFARRAICSACCVCAGVADCKMPAASSRRRASGQSKSSPPSAVSPAVASTRNKPRSNVSTLTSKVPPPRSNTA